MEKGVEEEEDWRRRGRICWFIWLRQFDLS